MNDVSPMAVRWCEGMMACRTVRGHLWGADALLPQGWLLGVIHLRWPAFYQQVILAAVTFSDGIMCFVTKNLQATIFLKTRKLLSFIY